jgi:hypothetical protein
MRAILNHRQVVVAGVGDLDVDAIAMTECLGAGVMLVPAMAVFF